VIQLTNLDGFASTLSQTWLVAWISPDWLAWCYLTYAKVITKILVPRLLCLYKKNSELGLIAGSPFAPSQIVGTQLQNIYSLNIKPQIRLCVQHTLWNNVFLRCHDLVDNLHEMVYNENKMWRIKLRTGVGSVLLEVKWFSSDVLWAGQREYSGPSALFWFYSLVFKKDVSGGC
jgi:hypothetical protein